MHWWRDWQQYYTRMFVQNNNLLTAPCRADNALSRREFDTTCVCLHNELPEIKSLHFIHVRQMCSALSSLDWCQ